MLSKIISFILASFLMQLQAIARPHTELFDTSKQIQSVFVSTAHLLDPIPGAPIGSGVEVLTGTPAKEAYEGLSSDAEQYYAVSQSITITTQTVTNRAHSKRHQRVGKKRKSLKLLWKRRQWLIEA
jgi:hypothetical protein